MQNKEMSIYPSLSDFHQVDGTIVVRISNGLTASEQKALYNEIIDKIHSTN